MASPTILDAEAEGRRIASADQPVDVWMEHFCAAEPEIAGDQPSLTTDGGRRLRPQSTSATDPVGLPVALYEPPLDQSQSHWEWMGHQRQNHGHLASTLADQ